MGQLEDQIMRALLRLRETVPDLDVHMIVFPTSNMSAIAELSDGQFGRVEEQEVTLIYRKKAVPENSD